MSAAVGRRLVGAPLLAVAAWGLLRTAGFRLPLVPMMVLFLVVALLQRVAQAGDAAVVRVPAPQAPATAGTRRPASLSTLVDATGMARWEGRLAWLDGDTSAFVARLQPQLVELVEQRLWLRHGVSRATDGRRAREILGEELWTLLHEPLAAAPTPRRLAAIVTRIEQL